MKNIFRDRKKFAESFNNLSEVIFGLVFGIGIFLGVIWLIFKFIKFMWSIA